jgi:hypothetical protein
VIEIGGFTGDIEDQTASDSFTRQATTGWSNQEASEVFREMQVGTNALRIHRELTLRLLIWIVAKRLQLFRRLEPAESLGLKVDSSSVFPKLGPSGPSVTKITEGPQAPGVDFGFDTFVRMPPVSEEAIRARIAAVEKPPPRIFGIEEELS